MEATQTAASPLDVKWWLETPPEVFPPQGSVLLSPYDRSRQGVELLCAEACRSSPELLEVFPAEGEFLRVNLWNVLEGIGCGPRPGPEDTAYIERIDAMQRSLGPLTDDVRYLRLQIACLERCHRDFPRTVDVMIEGIAAGRPDPRPTISCEPPWAWLRRVLCAWQGLEPNLNLSQLARAQAYLRVLTAYAAEAAPEVADASLGDDAELAERTYRRLGPPTFLKLLQVERLIASVRYWAFPDLRFPHHWERYQALQNELNAKIEEKLGGREDLLKPLIAINDGEPCHHSYFRHLDYQIAVIGAGEPVEMEGRGEERRRILNQVANYVNALGSWMGRRSAAEAVENWPASENLVHKVCGILGSPTPVKRWLAACLWATLRINQANRGRGHLEEQPERFRLHECHWAR